MYTTIIALPFTKQFQTTEKDVWRKGKHMQSMENTFGGLVRINTAECQNTIRLYKMEWLYQIWVELHDYIPRPTTLTDLVLDFTAIECPMGCCRADTLALEMLKHLEAFGENLPRLWAIEAEQNHDKIEQIIIQPLYALD